MKIGLIIGTIIEMIFFTVFMNWSGFTVNECMFFMTFHLIIGIIFSKEKSDKRQLTYSVNRGTIRA
jgi:uncharacterized membrane protein YqhA